MPVASAASDLPMDHRMVDADADPIGPLWIRRQVFEHSVAVPLLTSTTASQIDFNKLASELLASSVTTDPNVAPAITYDSWVTAAGLHARLDSSEDAGIIIEALETNAPDAFVRCNDPSKLAPGRQLNYRQLLIPVPELLAFMKLHAAATIASRFRESADAVWPETDANAASNSPAGSGSGPVTGPTPFSLNQGSPRHQGTQLTSPGSPPVAVSAPSLSLSPASPRLQQGAHPSIASPGGLRHAPLTPPAAGPVQGSPQGGPQPMNVSSPAATQSPGPPTSPGLDGLVRKKTPTHLGAMVHSQSAIIASVQHAFQRETRLVASNLKGLLLALAAAYGVVPESHVQGDIVSQESGIVMGGGAVAVESGTLDRSSSQGKPRRAHSLGSGSEVLMADDSTKFSTRNLPITRQIFEHMSFLLTTTCGPADAYRPVSWVVPQWREWSSTATVPLGELTDILTTALTRVPLQSEIHGSTDVAEIRDLDRKTILRSSIPNTNAGVTGYPHAKEVRISNCIESHFYLLASLGRVSLIACRDCTLFVGSCVSVSLINCVNVRVHAITRVCRVTNCFDTHIYLCTNRYPQIVGENRGLLFAPYNAAHDKEEVNKYLAAVGVDPNANVWDKFYRPAYRSISSAVKKDPDLTSAVAAVLQPEQFLPFAVPVRRLNGTSMDLQSRMTFEREEEGERDAITKALFSVPLPLPSAYSEQLKRKCGEITSIRREIRALEKRHATESAVEQSGAQEDSESSGKDTPMSDGLASPNRGSGEEGQNTPAVGKKGVLQSLVQERFREWLNHSGRIRQINDLVRVDQDT